MTQMPDYDLTPGPDPDVPLDPLTCAYEDYQESDEWSKALSAVSGVTVDNRDIAPFTTRDIPLSEVVGPDAAIDVASEGIIIGFEAGFRYGRRETTLDRIRARLDSGKSYHLAEDIATIIEEQTNGR